VIANAVKVSRIATGEEEEDCGPEIRKNKAAQDLGHKGGAGQEHESSERR
jgi:hypothetical protein